MVEEKYSPIPAWGKVGMEVKGGGKNESKPFCHRLQSHHQQEPSKQFKYKMNCFNI